MKFEKGAWSAYPVNLANFSILPDGTVEFEIGVPNAGATHYSKCVGRGSNFMEALTDAFKPSVHDPRDIGAVVKAAFLLGHQYGAGTLRVAVRDANGNEMYKTVGSESPSSELDS